MTNAGNEPRGGHRRRTLLGCLTCRARHVKCSLERPVCSNCTRLALDCAGYEGTLKWLNYGARFGKKVRLVAEDDQDNNDGQRGIGRRELFTVVERKRMSQGLATWLNRSGDVCVSQGLDQALTVIERRFNMDNHTVAEDRQIGPFGVFSCQISSSEPRESCSTLGSTFESERERLAIGHGLSLAESPARSSNVSDVQQIGSTPGDNFLSMASPEQILVHEDPGCNTTTHRSSRSHVSRQENDLIHDQICLDVQLNPLRDVVHPEPSHDLLIDHDDFTSNEIRVLFSHFSSHLSHLLSPVSLPSSDLWPKKLLDHALLSFSKLGVLGHASVDSCAVFYSFLAMCAAHMDAVFRQPRNFCGDLVSQRTEKQEKGDWYAPALRYARRSTGSLQGVLRRGLGTKEEYKRILLTFLNLNIAMAISDFDGLIADITDQCANFLFKSDPRRSLLLKSKAILCLEYLSLQNWVLVNSLRDFGSSVTTQRLAAIEQLRILMHADIWDGFPAWASNQAASHEDSEQMSFSFPSLHLDAGSPIPPSLLRLILECSCLIQPTGLFADSAGGFEISTLEEKCCSWNPGEYEEMNPSERRISVETGGQVFAASLTRAFHTGLLLLFFCFVKPTNQLLLKPLQEELVSQLEDYCLEVEEAEADVGIGVGMLWPLKVLEIVKPIVALQERYQALWNLVEGAGWRASP